MPNKVLRTLYLYNGIFVLGSSLLGPLYALFVETLTPGIMPVTISWAVYITSSTLSMYVISKIGDRFKHKRYLLATGYGVRAACWFSLIFITGIEQLIIIQILLGMGEALGTPAFDSIFAEHLDRGRHILDYSDWKITANVGMIAGTLAGGFVATVFGFHTLFALMTFLALVSMAGAFSCRSIDGKYTNG